MKSITKIGGITVATLLTLTIVSMSLMESADAQSNDRREQNQKARSDCRQGAAGAVVGVGVCVGGVNANVEALNDVTCSIFVLASGCQNR